MANTTTLTLNVTEQKLKLVTDTPIASGGLNDIILHFDFKDNTWDGLNIRAVFRSNYDEIAYENSVDASTKNVIVPAEVLHEHGTIYVGLAGSIVNGQGEATLVRTTAVLGLKLEKGTPSDYEESEESTRYWVTIAEMWATGGSGGTPSATNNAKYYAEIAEDLKDDAITAKNDAIDAKNDAVSAKNDAVSAKNDAITAKNNAVIAETNAVDAKNTAVLAKDDAITAKNDAVNAKTIAETAKTDAETAKTGAIDAKNDAETAKNSAVQAKNDAINAKVGAENAEDNAEEYAQNARDYANSVNPEKLVHKDSEEQPINGTMADVILSQADAENSQNLMGLLPVEPNEITTMSVVSTIPASMSSSGTTGQVAFDLDNKYVYICVASNSWKRFTLSDF